MVRSGWFDRMKFAPIISLRSLRSHCPTVGTKSHIGNRKLPPIVGPKSDMADYCRLPPIIIFPRRKFSHCPIFHLIFHPTLRSVEQWDAGLMWTRLLPDKHFVFRKAEDLYKVIAGVTPK